LISSKSFFFCFGRSIKKNSFHMLFFSLMDEALFDICKNILNERGMYQ